MENWSIPFVVNAGILAALHRYLQEIGNNVLDDAEGGQGEDDRNVEIVVEGEGGLEENPAEEDFRVNGDDFVEDDLILEEHLQVEELPTNGDGKLKIIDLVICDGFVLYILGDTPSVVQEIVILPDFERTKRSRNRWTTTRTDRFESRKG